MKPATTAFPGIGPVLAALVLVAVAALVLTGLVLVVHARPAPAPPTPAPSESPSDYEWRLPPGFPVPRVPADNPMSEAKVELGRFLFYDTRLSADGTMSCATCHRPELAFTDGRALPQGVTGELHPRSAMSLANVAYAVTLNWDDPELDRLEEQLRTPLFGHDPVEMGAGRSEELVAKLEQDWLTVLQFEAAFPGDPEPLSFDNLAKAIAAFERTLISGGSPFDRYWYGGEADALSPEARRGMQLFFSRRLSCGECHGRFTLSGPIHFEGSSDPEPEFHNTGLYNLDGDGDGVADGAYPRDNRGLARHTGEAEHEGRFRAPTLRNITLTAPYMHDGSIPTLDAVIDHYAVGGRTIEEGPRAGVGSLNPGKSVLLKGFALTANERGDLLAFLHALTDTAFVEDPRLAEPGGANPRAANPTGTAKSP